MRIPDRLPPSEISNSLSLQELWDKIQLAHGLPLSLVANCPPKHSDNLPELPNDVQEHKKCDVKNKAQSSASFPSVNGGANQHLRSDFVQLPSCQNSFSSRRAVSSQQLMRHLGDACLVSVTNRTPCMSQVPLEWWTRSQRDPRLGYFPISSSRIPWASDPRIPVRKVYDVAYLPTKHHPPPSPHLTRLLGISQTDHRPHTPPFPQHPLNDTNRGFDCVARRGLRPMLSETEVCQDKMQYRRDWRNLSNEPQGQYDTSIIVDGKKSVSVTKWKRYERKWEEKLHMNCDRSVLLLERLQPVEVRPSTISRPQHARCVLHFDLIPSTFYLQTFHEWLADKKNAWRKQQQMKWDGWDGNTIERGQFERMWEEGLHVECKRPMLPSEQLQPSVWEEGLQMNCDRSILLYERLQPVKVRPSTISRP
jgi:hypothetical protein